MVEVESEKQSQSDLILLVPNSIILFSLSIYLASMAQDADYVDPSISNKNKNKGKGRLLDPIDSDSDLDIEIDGLDSEDELLLSNNKNIDSNKKRKLNNNDGKSSKANSKKGAAKSGGLGKSKDQGYAWEATFKRSWEAVQEDEGGSLANSVKKLLQGNRRNR